MATEFVRQHVLRMDAKMPNADVTKVPREKCVNQMVQVKSFSILLRRRKINSQIIAALIITKIKTQISSGLLTKQSVVAARNGEETSEKREYRLIVRTYADIKMRPCLLSEPINGAQYVKDIVIVRQLQQRRGHAIRLVTMDIGCTGLLSQVKTSSYLNTL